MNPAQRAQLDRAEYQVIIDKCIADIIIEGKPRWQAIKEGSFQAVLTKDEFEQLVLARVEKLLRH